MGCTQRGEIWSSEVEPSPFDLAKEVTELGSGSDVAIGLSVTTRGADDVLEHLRRAKLPVQAYIDLAPQRGPCDRAIADASAARGWALAVRDTVREVARSTGTAKIHLFISSPGEAAFLLGHLWNRVPATQLYGDTSPGYAPAYLLPA